jgi:hypothetical protein
MKPIRAQKKRKEKKVQVQVYFDMHHFQTDENGTLTVSVVKDAKNLWRVTVWGNDDAGMERAGTLDESLTVFDAVFDGVERKTLIAQGFVQA